MSEYIDTILIECDRQSATIKNDSEPATWSNKQNNTINLLPNDKVSVYSSYVNDVGSGQDNPIEFRGKKLNKSKVITYVENQPIKTEYKADLKRSYVTYSKNVVTNETISLQDNKASAVINFYKTMDALNYIQLPRRFIRTTAELAASLVQEDNYWSSIDKVSLGRTHVETPNHHAATDKEEANYYGYVPQDIRGFLNYEAPIAPATEPKIGEPVHFISKNDNSRYTIMTKVFNVNPNQPGLVFAADATKKGTYHPPYYAREPEFFDYHVLREKIDLETDIGFSAAKNIADSLTQQLQKTSIKDREDFKDKEVEATEPNLDFVLNKRVESQTYKSFDCGSELLQSETLYKRALFNGPTTSLADITTPAGGCHLTLGGGVPAVYEVETATDSDAAFYYNGFRYIACKRPEIYETGCQLNDVFGIPTTNNLVLGDKLTQGLVLNIPYYATDNGLITGNIVEPKQPSPQLLRFKAYVESQRNYPELFSDDAVRKMYIPAENPYYDTVSGEVYINVDNARYAHMDTFVQADNTRYSNCDVISFDVNRFVDPTDIRSGPKNQFWKLGQSYYDYRGTGKRFGTPIGNDPTFNRELNTKSQSKPFYFHYDYSQKEELYEYPSSMSNFKSGKFTYGAFGRSVPADTLDGLGNHIIVYPNLLTFSQDSKTTTTDIGLPDNFFHNYGDGIRIEAETKMGFDRHWNAWGTSMINLQSGKGEYGYANTTRTTNAGGGAADVQTLTNGTNPAVAGSGLAQPDATLPLYPDLDWRSLRTQASDQLATGYYNNKIYCGADKPKIGFNGTNFFFERLHTPLNKGNVEQIEPLDDTSFDPTQGSIDVYKINPEQNYEMYSPVQYPYNRESSYYLAGSDHERKLRRMNFNLEPLTIYDTTTGIFIEDFGYTEESWDQGLWGRLGFTYAQFNKDTTTRNEIINLDNSVNLNIVTTNANIDCSDTKSWSQNQFSISKYNGEMLVNYTIPISTTDDTTKNQVLKLIRWIPPINQSATSIQISAQKYPISMFNGYYNIRSDIVGNSSFVDGSGNTRMPVVSIVNKQNPVGDFYISPETDISFTITKPTKLSSVSVSITEPDGSPAPVSLRSSVIFKVERIRTLNTNLAQELFEKLKNEIS